MGWEISDISEFTYMKNSEKKCRFSEKCSNSYKKYEKVIKLYRNSEKLREKFWEKFSPGRYYNIKYYNIRYNIKIII